MPTPVIRGTEKRPDQSKAKMGFYRLLASIHVEFDWDAVKPEDAGDDWRRPSLQYTQGEVVKSPTDLVAKFGPQKFQKVGGKGSLPEQAPVTVPLETANPVAPTQPETGSRSFDAEYGVLDQMTKAELLEVANSEEIEINHNMTKAEILAELRKAESAKK